jgi:hypothetical protein
LRGELLRLLSAETSNLRPKSALVIAEQRVHWECTVNDAGDVCRASNLQLKQRALGLIFGQTIFADDRRDSIGNVGIAKYLK